MFCQHDDVSSKLLVIELDRMSREKNNNESSFCQSILSCIRLSINDWDQNQISLLDTRIFYLSSVDYSLAEWCVETGDVFQHVRRRNMRKNKEKNRQCDDCCLNILGVDRWLNGEHRL